jgi:Ca-activated chloride channel family protein
MIGLVSAQVVHAESAREALQQGNRLFGDSKYSEAVNKYNEALVEQPQAMEPKFNKAGSYYRMDDLGQAMDLYREVAADSKDMSLVAKAKYNLGNCFFQRGSKQRDSDLQKALEDMKTSITWWRQVLDLDPKNEKAARNIEVARLTIKDILDQIKQQQKDQQKQQDPNQPQQQEQQQKQQDQSQSGQEPNQPQDPNQAKQGAQPQDPNQTQDQQKQPQERSKGQDKQQKQMVKQDATAQEIIDNEQRQKREREIRQQRQYQQVERDW